MDSKNIFISASHMLTKCKWEEFVDGNEWRSVGDHFDFKTDYVQVEVDRFFCTKSLFLVTDRHGSRAIASESAAQLIADSMTIGTIYICDQSFRMFMEFSAIGVSRRGVVSHNKWRIENHKKLRS